MVTEAEVSDSTEVLQVVLDASGGESLWAVQLLLFLIEELEQHLLHEVLEIE